MSELLGNSEQLLTSWLYTLEYGGEVVDYRLSLKELDSPFGLEGRDFRSCNHRIRSFKMVESTSEIESLRAKVKELEAFTQEVRRTGDTRLASMAIAVMNKIANTSAIYDTQPPSTQAAVSAVLIKAAEECTLFGYNDMAMQILALPHDDSHLRELMMRVAEEVNDESPCDEAYRLKYLQDIVDRVLKGE